nr:hypothetical protein pPsy0462a_00017 [Pseudomonas syringae]
MYLGVNSNEDVEDIRHSYRLMIRHIRGAVWTAYEIVAGVERGFLIPARSAVTQLLRGQPGAERPARALRPSPL